MAAGEKPVPKRGAPSLTCGKMAREWRNAGTEMSDSWLWMSAADLGRGIGAGRIDPRELTEVYLSAIDAHPQTEGIYARTTPERARAEADAAGERARAGVRRGPLDGVPISWKDLFDSAGVATEAGSALLKGRVPDRDAEVLARAGRAGLVCLGKTHMSELAFSGLGVNPVTATPPNINDPELAPGGSSSGAAASVAFGLAAAGIGSDTGGSVRIPAAWNDLVGLKTTHGVLPLDGVVPLASRFDTVGPLCRSVEDAALIFAVLAGEAPADLEGASLRGVRLMVLEGVGPVREVPEASFEAAVARLEAAGARIERRALDCVAEALPLPACLYTTEGYAEWGAEIEARPELMFHQIRDRFLAGASFTGAEFVQAERTLGGLRKEYRIATAGYDAVLLPSTLNLPPNVDRLLAESDYYRSENLLALRNTVVGNLMGLCALSLPTDTPSCGLMAMAPPGRERALLRLGAAMEAALT
jgi:aspartyl-tRNA(Asn)/glutamyl-tRNA(Gln) amidotransferase subunit A